MMKRRGHALRRRYGRSRYGHMRFPGHVIPSRRWRRSDGQTASIYGAAPWTGSPGNQKDDWRMEDAGWTISWSDGTVGIGRVPFSTQGEAEAWLQRENNRIAEAREIQRRANESQARPVSRGRRKR